MTRRGLWVAVIVGAALFAGLVVWLYTLLGYAVVIPLGVAGAAYFEIRLSGISEQLDAFTDPAGGCSTARGWGECVLADGHETREQEDVGSTPCTTHVDRWGRHWGVGRG